jgi:hypothetical protein
MGSPDYREQFNHALSILQAAKVGYVHVMDGLGFGFHNLGALLYFALHTCCQL